MATYDPAQPGGRPDWATSDDADPGRPATARFTTRQIRDLAGLLLVLAGVAGLTTVAFAVDVHLGWTATATAVLAAGVLLGLDR